MLAVRHPPKGQRERGVMKVYNDDLITDYEMFDEIPIEDAIAIFLGKDYHIVDRENFEFEKICLAMIRAINKDLIKATTERDINGNILEAYITHETAKQWADTYGLKWNVAPYKPLINSAQPSGNNSQIIAEKEKEIAELKAEIEKLKLQAQSGDGQAVINYDECSIHGHTTQEIKAIFGAIKRFWTNHDLSDPSTIETAKTIKEWIEKEYQISQSNADAIQKIIRPPQAKNLGRREK